MRTIVEPNASLFISVAASCRHGTASGVAILVCLGPRLFPPSSSVHTTPPHHLDQKGVCVVWYAKKRDTVDRVGTQHGRGGPDHDTISRVL